MSIPAGGWSPSGGSWDVAGINGRGMSPGWEPARVHPKGTDVPARRCQCFTSDVTLCWGGQWWRLGVGSQLQSWLTVKTQRRVHSLGQSPAPRTATFPHQDRAFPRVPAPLEPLRGGDSSPWSPAARTGPSILPETGGKADMGDQDPSCVPRGSRSPATTGPDPAPCQAPAREVLLSTATAGATIGACPKARRTDLAPGERFGPGAWPRFPAKCLEGWLILRVQQGN